MGKQYDFEVAHLDGICDCWRSLLFSEDLSDITFIVDNERVPAHKLILATRCDFSRPHLNKDSLGKEERELPDGSVESFKHFLRYVYTGSLSLRGVRLKILLDILSFSYTFGILKLQDVLSQYLQKEVLSVSNACTIYEMARCWNIESLSQQSLRFIDRNADAIIKGEDILELSAKHLREILDGDSFFVDEIEIFEAVKRWAAKQHNNEDISEVVGAIRLSLIAERDLMTIVRGSKLVPTDQVLAAIVRQQEENGEVDRRHCGSLIPEVNLGTTERDNGNHDENDEDHDADVEDDSVDEEKFTFHKTEDNTGITVDFGKPLKINHVVLRLSDWGPPTYSYYVEVSTSRKNWRRVVDYSNYCCRSLQKLYFEPQVCRYIRIVAVTRWENSSIIRIVNLVSFEAMFTKKSFRDRQGIVIPERNVASLKMEALVVQGDNGEQNDSSCQDMIDGDWQNYDWSSGFTQHTINDGCIIVQLAQPYIIDSIRMLLWCRDSRKYSYYIETSTDKKKWTRVVDHTRELCRSWQHLSFEARPVVFIKIVGTASTAIGSDRRWFHVVHFECPMQK